MCPIHAARWLCFAFLCPLLSAADNAPLSTIASVESALRDNREWAPFNLEVKALSPILERGGGAFLAEDRTGRAIIHIIPKCDSSSVRPGELLKISGKTSRCDLKMPSSAILPLATSIVSIGYEEVPPPPKASIRDILSGKWNLHYVTVSGTVKRAFHDDIDPLFDFLILVHGGACMYIPLRKRDGKETGLASLIGAEVSVRGIVHGNDGTGARRHADVTMLCGGFDSVQILRNADGMDCIPILEDVRSMNPESISTMDRRRTSGRVVATWGGNQFLMKTASANLMRIELADCNLPRCGDMVEVAGFPETDLFNVNFESAMWRPAPNAPEPPPDEPPKAVSAKTLLSKSDGANIANSTFFGKTVSIRGATVLNVPEAKDGRILIENEGFTIPIDASVCPTAFNGVEAGCRVDVTGVFVFEADNWRANDIFPKITDVAIVVRDPSDIAVLSRPSWWTPGRLLIVIGVLVVVIVVVLLWNSSLRILAERRGQALYRARMAKTASEMRVSERTRLATELHDYISQDMTAISYQVTAARHSHCVDPAECAIHLDTAERMLGSCRTELRRCLWDLRNEALDEKNIAKAVETSIGPITKNIATEIRIDIHRDELDDSTMHAMLSIIRELTANAVTHGRATVISIKGTAAKDKLVITVADNGIGFVVEERPSAADGHFGLAGAEERALQHGGSLSVESVPGSGTCVTVTLAKPITQ